MREVLKEIESRLEVLKDLLSDDSRQVKERVDEFRRGMGELDAIVRQARSEGLSTDDPDFLALRDEGMKLMASMNRLADASSPPTALSSSTIDPEIMGRRAARLEAECYQRVFDVLASSPPPGEVVEKLESLRDDFVRRMVGQGAQRDFFLGGRTRDSFDRALTAALEESTEELESRLTGELSKRYAGTGLEVALEDLVSLHRFLTPKRLGGRDREHLERLGFLGPIPESVRARLAEADRMLDELVAIADDESRTAEDRISSIRERVPPIETFLMEVMAEGPRISLPAVMALRAKSQQIGVKLARLTSRG
jgi:hypothetical protein